MSTTLPRLTGLRRASCALAAPFAALALAAAGCGGGGGPETPAAAATVSGHDVRAAASPEQRSAGWAAPGAVAGGRTGELSEEFRSGSQLQRWGYFEGDHGRNRMLVRDGRLDVTPSASRWSDRERAFYLYREVRGDFDARARVRVTEPVSRPGVEVVPGPGSGAGHPATSRSASGAAATAGDASPRRPVRDDASAAAVSVAGLLVRAQRASYGDGESWVALGTGLSEGRRVIWRGSTADSLTNVATTAARRGWVDLRVRRHGGRVLMWSRVPGGRWDERGTLVRDDLPPAVQVGVAASSDSGRSRAQVEWVRFERP